MYGRIADVIPSSTSLLDYIGNGHTVTPSNLIKNSLCIQRLYQHVVMICQKAIGGDPDVPHLGGFLQQRCEYDIACLSEKISSPRLPRFIT